MGSNLTSKTIASLATIERKNGEEQLRVSLDEFISDDGKAHRYVSARIWYQSGEEWRPTKKGITIRKTEIRDFALALKAGLARMNQGSEPASRATSPATHRTGTLVEADPNWVDDHGTLF
jgi:hypothetical protein